MNKLTCSCGNKTNNLKWLNGKAVCNKCQTETLSGKWERKNSQDRQYYAKDIIQPDNPHFKEVYGNSKTKESI